MVVEKSLNTELINTKLESLGLSIPALAEKLGVTREIVYKWIKKEKFPRPANLLELTRALGVQYRDLVLRDLSSEPVIAFRKRAHTKTTEEHIERAVNMGKALEPLVPYMPFDTMSMPAKLISPSTNYEYVQKAASEVRRHFSIEGGLIDVDHIIELFSLLHAVLIPVLWGSKKNHENALHIYLPKSMTTWIYINLDTHLHDFKFWMAHELGHVKAPDLRGDEAEEFADAFAGAMLFPEHLAKEAYDQLLTIGSDAIKINQIKAIANHHVISMFTVLNEANKYASSRGLENIRLNVGPANTVFNKQFPLMSEVLLKSKQPEARSYIQVAKKFKSPFFDGLRNYLLEHKKSPSLVSRVLNISAVDAHSLYEGLTCEPAK